MFYVSSTPIQDPSKQLSQSNTKGLTKEKRSFHLYLSFSFVGKQLKTLPFINAQDVQQKTCAATRSSDSTLNKGLTACLGCRG